MMTSSSDLGTNNTSASAPNITPPSSSQPQEKTEKLFVENEKTEQELQEELQKACPELEANFFSRMLLYVIYYILLLGSRSLLLFKKKLTKILIYFKVGGSIH